MSTSVRFAFPSDDLRAIWPAQGALKLNREQVLVAVDEAGELQGGALLFDAGHEVIWVAEVTPIVEDGRRWIYKALVESLIAWSRERGARALLFLAPEPSYQAQALRCGATFVANSTVMAMQLGGGGSDGA